MRTGRTGQPGMLGSLQVPPALRRQRIGDSVDPGMRSDVAGQRVGADIADRAAAHAVGGSDRRPLVWAQAEHAVAEHHGCRSSLVDLHPEHRVAGAALQQCCLLLPDAAGGAVVDGQRERADTDRGAREKRRHRIATTLWRGRTRRCRQRKRGRIQVGQRRGPQRQALARRRLARRSRCDLHLQRQKFRRCEPAQILDHRLAVRGRNDIAEYPATWHRRRSRGGAEAVVARQRRRGRPGDDRNDIAPGWRRGERCGRATRVGDLRRGDQLDHVAVTRRVFDDEIVAGSQVRVVAGKCGAGGRGRQAAILVAPGVEIETVMRGADGGAAQRLEHQDGLARRLRPRGDLQAATGRQGGNVVHVELQPGIGRAPIDLVADQRQMVRHRAALRRGVEIGLAGQPVLHHTEAVGRGGEQFHQHHAEIGLAALGPGRHAGGDEIQ